MSEHPLAVVLTDAAAGRFPEVDGRVEVLPPPVPGRAAIVEFTGHAFVLTDRTVDDLVAAGADGFGGVGLPEVVSLVAGPSGRVGSHDVVLVAAGTGLDPHARRLPRRLDLDAHPRVVRARHHRVDVVVHGDDDGVVTIGSGLVGRREVSVELTRADAPPGAGRRLVAAALDLVPAGAAVWAQVAPGNAASLRAFLACGFRPIGAEILIETG